MTIPIGKVVAAITKDTAARRVRERRGVVGMMGVVTVFCGRLTMPPRQR